MRWFSIDPLSPFSTGNDFDESQAPETLETKTETSGTETAKESHLYLKLAKQEQ